MTAPSHLQIDANGWQAYLNLGFVKQSVKTVLRNREQFGPLTVQRPFYPEGDVCHLYLLHPPGGVVGGDELRINVEVKEEGNVLITTPGATKFYLNSGKLAKQIQTLVVKKNSSLEWFPQENIFFNDTHSQLTTRIELEKNAQFMGWEINCYGRPASNELFEKGHVGTNLEILRDGEFLLLDKLTITDSDVIQSPTCLNGNACYGTFISTQATPESLDKARKAIKGMSKEVQIGITLLDDILIARCLGQFSEKVMSALKLIWMVLRPEILGRNACHPRIWST